MTVVSVGGGEIAARHWRDVRRDAAYPDGAGGWFDWSRRWPNFSPEELACRGTGALRLHIASVDRLQRLREALGAPIIVSSAYRSPEHNRDVGGATRSAHLLGRAFDCRMDNHDPSKFEAVAFEAGFQGFGFYPSAGFMHVDTGPRREWGRRWEPRRGGSRFASVVEPEEPEVTSA